MRLCSMFSRILAFCMISSIILPTAKFGKPADGNAFPTMERIFQIACRLCQAFSCHESLYCSRLLVNLHLDARHGTCGRL